MGIGWSVCWVDDSLPPQSPSAPLIIALSDSDTPKAFRSCRHLMREEKKPDTKTLKPQRLWPPSQVLAAGGISRLPSRKFYFKKL